ncbi:MAG: fibronectin type III domain-containing protein, partial [Candidatus Nanopelagicales bacterium]
PSCTITELTNGTEYVVSVVALNAAGSSAPATVTMTPRGEASLVITGTRSRNNPKLVKILGAVTGLDVTTVQPYVRLGRAKGFQPTITRATVGDEGRFRWQRRASKRITIYVEAAETTSNRVTIRAR